MDAKLVGRMRKGFGAQIFSQISNLFIRLAEVPLFLMYWGASSYGEWLMIAAIPAYLAMADGGFTGCAQREMTMSMGGGKRREALVTFQSAWMLLLVASSVIMIVAILAAIIIWLIQWAPFVSMPGTILSLMILLLSAHVALSFQCGLIYGGYACEGRYGRGTFLLALVYLLDFGGLAFAVMLGGGPVQAALGLLLGRLLGLVIFRVDLSKVAPWIHFGWQNASKNKIAQLLRPSLASMAFPLGEALNNQGMRLAIGLVLGPIAVTVFSTIRTLCRSVVKPVVMITRISEPEIARAYGASQSELVRNLFTRSCQIMIWTALPTCLVLWFGGELLFTWWTGGRIAFDAALYGVLIISTAINGLWYTALMVPYATNRHERIAVCYALFYGAGALVLSVPLMSSFQQLGAGLALLTSELIMAFIVLPIAMQLCNESLRKWSRTVIQPPLFLFEKDYIKK